MFIFSSFLILFIVFKIQTNTFLFRLKHVGFYKKKMLTCFLFYRARLSKALKMVPKRHVAYALSVHQVAQEPTNYNIEHFQNKIVASKYNILYVNIESLGAKLEDLESYLHEHHQNGIEIHIVAVTEIDINVETSKYYNITDYSSFYSTNADGEGGVALFVHKSLPSGVIANEENGLINCLIANIPVLNVNVGVLYKHPNASTQELIQCYKSMLKRNQRTLFFGDVDINLLATNASTRQYTDAVREKQFSILNEIHRNSATRIDRVNGRVQHSISDHVLSNIKQFNYSLSLIEEHFSHNKIVVLGFDDRKPQKIEFVAEPDIITYKMVVYRKNNYFLNRIKFRKILSIDDLVNKFGECKELSMVTKQRRRKNDNWRHVNTNRSEWYARRINGFNGDKRKHWNIIDEFFTNKTSGKHSICAMYNKYGQVEYDKKKVANIYNDFCLGIGKNLNAKIPQMKDRDIPEVDYNPNCIQPIRTNTAEILQIIEQMKNSNSIHDTIPANTLKYHRYKLAPVLARLINKQFDAGIFPESLKVDRIVPAYKNLDPLVAENYRPIGIAPALSKILVIESIICKRIIQFCQQNSIIADDQYGFQKGSSAISAVVSVLDYLQVGLSENPGSIGGGLFIDLQKASNTIPHDLLLHKLARLGIRGQVFKLIRSYLHERRQFVDIDNTLSDEIINDSEYSIPQGSSLGPLFFLLYINDIFKTKLHGRITLFGDDTAVVYVEPDLETLEKHMAKDLKELNIWFTKNGLSLNAEKTKAMVFKDEYIDPQIKLMIRNKPIEFVSNHKYLGIEFQSNLKWDVQINKIERKIQAFCCATRNIGDLLTRTSSWEIYQKFVYNPLAKMASIFGLNATDAQKEHLRLVQNMAVKKIFADAKYYNNADDFYVEHRMLRVQNIIDYDLALLIYKYVNDLLKLNRSVNNIQFGRNILSVGVRYFNSLHPSIRNNSDVIQFKRKFKRNCFFNS